MNPNPNPENAPLPNETENPPVPVVESNTEAQLNSTYSAFQKQVMTLGKQVNELWQRAWQERFFAMFNKYATNSGAYLRIAQGTPPTEAPKILEALKHTGHTVTRIEFDEQKSEFRVYTVPK